MILIANRQLTGSYGMARLGDKINVTDPDAVKELLRSGVASMPPLPKIYYETKVVVAAPAPEGAGSPFRHLYLPNDQPKGEVPTEGDQVVSSADVSEQAAPDSPGRRRQSRRKQ